MIYVPTSALAGDTPQAPQIDYGSPAAVPLPDQTGVPQDALNGQAVTSPVPPPFAQQVATSANTLSAANPAPQEPGAWAKALVGGVQDALAGFGAGGKVPEGAGALYGIGAAARQAQAQRAQQQERQDKLKQQATQNQMEQTRLQSETNRNNVLNAYTMAQTVADQRTSSRLDEEERDKHAVMGQAFSKNFATDHVSLGKSVPEEEGAADFKVGGKYDPNKVVAFHVGTIETEKDGKMVPMDTYDVYERSPIQVDVSPESSAILKQFGQEVPAGTKIDSDKLNSLATQAIASATTTSLLDKAADEANLHVQSVQNNKDKALVNPYLGAHPGDEISALTQLSAQKTPAGQAAQRLLSTYDQKELETYRHDKAEERNQAAELAQKKATAGLDFTGAPNTVGQQYLSSLGPGEQSMIKLIYEGRADIKNLGYLAARKPEQLDAVERAYPGQFDGSKVDAYAKAYTDFTSGKAADALTNGGTALQHLAELRDLNTKFSRLPIGSDKSAFQSKLNQVVGELGQFYKENNIPGAEHLRSNLGTSIGFRDSAIRTAAASLGDKLYEMKTRWQNASPSSVYEAKMPQVSDGAKQALAKLDPETAQKNGFVQATATNPKTGEEIYIRWRRMATPQSVIPPPPAGFQLDSGLPTTAPAENIPPPPAGFQLDQPPPSGQSAVSSAPPLMTLGKPEGLKVPGNINLNNRPVVQNADGTHSSEYSLSFGTDKGEVLVPTVVNGRFLTPDGKKPPEGSPAEKAMFKAAMQHYLKTGEHMGIFDTPEHADTYANVVHQRGDKPLQSSTVSIGESPVDLTTGAGASEAATRQAQQVIGNQAEQMHGAVSLMGQPTASIAAEKSAADAFESPIPSAENAPEGSKGLASIAEGAPAALGAVAAMPFAAGGVAKGLSAAGSKVAEGLPSAKRSGQAFQELEQSIGKHPVGVDSDLSKSVNEIKKAVSTTNTNIPPVVRKLIDRIDPFQGGGDLTYEEARAFSSEIGNLAVNDKLSMTPNTKRLIGNLDQALTNTIQKTADLAGEGKKLAGAMKEYHNAMTISGLTDKAKSLALKGALGAAGYAIYRELFD